MHNGFGRQTQWHFAEGAEGGTGTTALLSFLNEPLSRESHNCTLIDKHRKRVGGWTHFYVGVGLESGSLQQRGLARLFSPRKLRFLVDT